jgi:hypothetical protein
MGDPASDSSTQASAAALISDTSASAALSEQQLVYIGLGTIVVGGAIWYFVAHHKSTKRR